MAKMIEGVTENILKCAKEEFLANGYENASLRNIAEKAGTTKSSLLYRYSARRRYTTVLSSLLLMAFASCYKKRWPGLRL